MTRRHPAGRPGRLGRGAAAALVGVAALGSLPFAGGTAAAAPAAQAAQAAQAVEAVEAVEAAPAAQAVEAAPATPAGTAAPEPALPLTITVTALDPRNVTPDATVTVTAVLRNTTKEATGPLRVRLQRGARMTTRGELADADTNPRPTGGVFTPAEPVQGGFAAGQSRTVTYRVPVAALGLRDLGVYPVALVAIDEAGGAVGRAQTYLPYFPPTVDPVRNRVAFLWPLLDRPHRLLGRTAQPAVFDDDLLARAVSKGGRLDRLLGVAERVTGSVRLTIAVDPETIEELTTMVAGYRVTTADGRSTVPGRGRPQAAAWLSRLKKIAPEHLVMAVPYGDPDVVALERGGIGSLAQLLPGDVEATARALGVRPTTELSWPPDGQLTDTTLDDVVSQGAKAVLLDRTALPGGPGPDAPRTVSGVSPLPAFGGKAVALVPDPVVQRLVAAGGARKNGFAGGPRLAEQRLLAELAMIAAEAPSDVRTLVIAPPRRWDPTADYAAAVLGDLVGMPWLASATALDAAGSTAPQQRGPLIYPAGAQRRELSTPQVQQIGTVRTLVDDFRGALANPDANAELTPFRDALRRAGSSAWRGDLQAGRVYAARLRRQIGTLRSKVTLTAPSSGTYTLTSSESPLSITVENGLDVPVKVRIRMDVPPGFEIKDGGEVAIPPGQKRSLRLTAAVQRTGMFTVRGQLTTPAGGPLGQEITLNVRSTAYGGLALGVTGLAFAVLVAAVLVRLVRRLRARDVGPPAAAGTPADRGRL